MIEIVFVTCFKIHLNAQHEKSRPRRDRVADPPPRLRIFGRPTTHSHLPSQLPLNITLPSLPSSSKNTPTMAPNLGKRTRSSDLGTADASPSPFNNPSLPASKRVKRQARGDIFNDEQENPLITQSRDAAQDGDSMDLDELCAAVPAKHGIAGTRIPLSPSKIKHHFTPNSKYFNADNSEAS
jgi:hypothetical protein